MWRANLTFEAPDYRSWAICVRYWEEDLGSMEREREREQREKKGGREKEGFVS